MSDVERKDDVTLTAADEAAVDSLMERAGGAEGADVARRERAAAWMAVLGKGAVPVVPGDLAERTILRVADERMKIAASVAGAASAARARGVSEKEIDQQVRRRWSRQLANIGAMLVAASILMVVTMMGLGQIKQSHLRTMCATNLKEMGTAFASYAGANLGQLPSLVTPADENWLANKSGDGAVRNSGNLMPLLSGGYRMSMANFYCAAVLPEKMPTTGPGDLGEIGYSYTHLYGAARPSWDGKAGTIVMADRNPLFAASGTGAPPTKNPDVNSLNHGGHGNYILSADGNVKWETSPNVGPGGDNIWTVARGKERVVNYVGTEMPAGVGDVFVCP